MTYFLIDLGLGHVLAEFIAVSLGVIGVATFGLTWTLFGIWLERKVAGRFQDRLGPNRVGPFGLFQSIADAIKIVLKEDIMPVGVDRWVFNLAPILMVMSVLLLWAVIPFGTGLVGTNLSIGVLYLIAVGSLGSIAVIMAGWSSNNKYALLGAFRGAAQLVSYEVPMVLAMLVPVILAGSMRTEDIIGKQYIIYLFAIPLTAFIFIVSSMAELGRAPFDLLEAESEIVAGFHTEYSGMKFGMFYVGEFLHTFTVAVLAAMFFLGGWRGPFADDTGFTPRVLGLVYLSVKSQIAYLALMWVRMTVPRVRIDQMLGFNWKFLVPLSMINLLVVAFVWKLIPDTELINSFSEALLPSLVLLLANLAMIAGVAMILRAQGRRERARLQVYAVGETAAGD